jgi:hypothetical protein
VVHELYLGCPPPNWVSEKLLDSYYSGDQIEKNEMGGARNTFWGEERFIQGFGGET